MGAPGTETPTAPLPRGGGPDRGRVVVLADLDLALAGGCRPRPRRSCRATASGRSSSTSRDPVPGLVGGAGALVKVAAALRAGAGGLRVVAAGQPYDVLEMTEVLELLHVERADGG